jgi:hypothetical protein
MLKHPSANHARGARTDQNPSHQRTAGRRADGEQPHHTPSAAKIAIPLLALLATLAFSAPAFAISPWWHLTSGARPAYLNPLASGPQDEVQKLTVSATSGSYDLESGEHSALVPYNATPEEVQAAVEHSGVLTRFGADRVEVSASPSGEGGAERSYMITYTGAEADLYVASPEVGRPPAIEALRGGRAEASITQVTEGGPGNDEIVVTATNLGDADLNVTSEPVTITDTLPNGLHAIAIKGRTGTGTETCSLESLACTFSGIVPAYGSIEIVITVTAAGASSGELNRVSVSGGGAQGVSIGRPITVSDSEPPAGVEDYEMASEEEGGALDTQAGSHPFQLTTTLTLNQLFDPSKHHNGELLTKPVEQAKDLNFRLPPGLVGDTTPIPRCTLGQFLHEINFHREDECTPQTAVGVAQVTVIEPGLIGLQTYVEPLFNLEPAVGEPARFGFFVQGLTPVILDTSVRTGGDYGVTVSVNNITQIVSFLSSQVTFWGVPGDSRHDISRGWACIADDGGREEGDAPCAALGEHKPPPLLALPTSCTGPLVTSIETDSWQHEGSFQSFPTNEPLPSLDGCNELPFSPSISVAPDGEAGSTPSGLTVDVHVPQDVSLNPEGLSEADVKDTTVALPVGVALNPAAADGLQACSDTPEPGRPEGQIALNSTEAVDCPEASKVGTVKIKTPLLPNALEGSAYLAAQNENPFGSLVALYVVAQDPVSGVLVKLAGEVVPDPVTGQLVSTFKNTPQLPFDDFELKFFGGSRAPLVTPAACAAYTTTSTIAPWSGSASSSPSSTFNIISGPNGSRCQSPPPFVPSLTAYTTSIQAGGFTPFTMTMSREDGSQNLQAIQLHMPAGLSGLLAGVKLCGEPQADAGTCGAESEIGETIVSVGLGGDPFSVTGGKVFITGPYDGAPFGLSIVNPAKAGPYDLEKGTPCDCVVVRARIEVDPHTAALTITSDDSGPYKIPTILDGIPLQIQHVNVTVNRPGFTINPTNCNPMAITGTMSSTEGASSPLSVPFQVTNCGTLAFAPKFAVSTSGKTSKAYGASLTAKLSYPTAAQGTQANISRVKVDLPKQLPSRLTTLQKACTSAQFEANPANCPAASKIGYATVTTPLLPVALNGPAIFVSHGGEAFPSLTMVLQGYGVTIDLVGATFISKTGITSTTFKTVPDTPFNTFTLTLSEGKYSALAANGNLCTSKLAMPTEFVAQNGLKINQSTPIAVTGCAKAKKLTRTQQLTKALKACKKKSKDKRATCEKQVRKQYGPAKGAKKRKQH